MPIIISIKEEERVVEDIHVLDASPERTIDPQSSTLEARICKCYQHVFKIAWSTEMTRVKILVRLWLTFVYIQIVIL